MGHATSCGACAVSSSCGINATPAQFHMAERKADLAAEDSAVILGVLTEAAEALPATAATSAAPAENAV